tara:strand:- start:195 stop:419 length:225 start_codon:yes stop_codon:yes gene_type:complete
MSTNKSKAMLSNVTVYLKRDGNIEVTYNNVTADKFREVMNNSMPSYTNTELIYGYMKRLENVTKEYLDDLEKLL